MIRRNPNLSEKLAALLIAHYEIPRETAKGMTVKQILALFEFDHYPIAWNLGRDLGYSGEEINHPTNLQPLFHEEHMPKSAKIDTPRAAKGKRLTKAQEEHRRRMLAPRSADAVPSRWPAGRKMASRPFPKKQKEKSRVL